MALWPAFEAKQPALATRPKALLPEPRPPAEVRAEEATRQVAILKQVRAGNPLIARARTAVPPVRPPIRVEDVADAALGEALPVRHSDQIIAGRDNQEGGGLLNRGMRKEKVEEMGRK